MQMDLDAGERLRPVIHVSLAIRSGYFDEKAARLLSLVDETHSVRHACNRMQISYSAGWKLLNELERELGDRLIVRNQGGPRGSHSLLTEKGRSVLELFFRYEETLRREAERLYNDCCKGDMV